MEEKLVRVPFEVELAKKIQNKECEGRIVTRNGRNVRIICFDAHCDDNIVALIEDEKGVEYPKSYVSDGMTFLTGECDCDLMLEVPDYVIYQDGDVIVTGWEENGESSKWISIVKSIKVYDDGVTTSDYVTLIVTSNNHKDGVIKYDGYTTSGKWTRKATEEERRMIIDKLKEDKDFRAVKYLKKFFPDEVKTEFKDGDIIAYDDRDAIVILEGEPKVNDNIVSFRFYVNMLGNDLNFYSDRVLVCVNSARKATPEEIQKLKDRLGKDDRLEAKVCLEKFFGIDLKQESDFTFKQLVLVRGGEDVEWLPAEFGFKDKDNWYCVLGGLYFKHCIPYNEQTKHLLGTTDDYKA